MSYEDVLEIMARRENGDSGGFKVLVFRSRRRCCGKAAGGVDWFSQRWNWEVK